MHQVTEIQEVEGTAEGEPAREERPGTCLYGIEGLATPGADKLRLTPGKVVPGTRYRIVRWLGEGGMGVVYEAEHVDIERPVALKILRFDLSQQPHMVEVFKAEAKASGRLGSRHVVEIYDFGELRDGRLFFAMELLDGRNLCPPENGPWLSPSALIGIMRQVCKGLARAHAAGIVHRDVKPENIILANVEGRRWVKLVDFGISSMLAAGQEWLSGRISGTPHYMAPEQILLEPFDHRLDLYALGCTAYELLTGVPPFRADSVEGVLNQHLVEAPEPPSKLAPRAGIPPELDALILRCLAKKPADRFIDASDLEAALCEVQIQANIVTEWDDLPIPEIPDIERRERIRKLMPSAHAQAAKHRWLWPAVAGMSTLAAAGLAAFLMFGRGPSEEEQSLVETLTIEARRAASTARWLAPPPGEPGGETAYHKILAIEAIEGKGEAFADERGEELRLDFSQTLARQGQQLWEHGAHQLALVYYLNALVFDPTNEEVSRKLDLPAPIIAGYLARAKEGSLSGEERALNLFAAAHVEEDAAAKQALEGQAATVLQETGVSEQNRAMLLAQALPKRSRKPREEAEDEPVVMLEEPEGAAEPAIDAGEPAPELPPPPPGRMAGEEGGAFARKAREPAKPAIVAEARDPALAKQLAEQGQVALQAGRRREAAALFNRAVASDRRNATALMGLSDVYFDTGQAQNAVEYAEKAVEAAPGNSSFRLKLGDAYFKALRYHDALRQYEDAKARGVGRAEARIAKVRAKLGG